VNSYRSGPPGSRGDLKSTFTLCDAMPTLIPRGPECVEVQSVVRGFSLVREGWHDPEGSHYRPHYSPLKVRGARGVMMPGLSGWRGLSGWAAGNGNWPWCPNYDYSAISGGDPREQVSSLFSAMVGSRPDLSLSPEGSDPEITSEDGGPMGMTTIAAHGGSPQGGRRSIEGGAQHPQYVRGGAKN